MLIYEMRTEYLHNPLGLDSAIPRFSWKINSDMENSMQKSYQLLAFSDADEKNLIWDSGIIASDQSQAVRWKGPVLKSRQQVFWKVKVSIEWPDETTAGISEEIAESCLSFFEMGLLYPEDWKADWIMPETKVSRSEKKPVPYLRKEFYVKKGLKKARIYQSAHGLYEFWINNIPGTNDKFKPGFTSYHKRTQYQIYDIGPLLNEGVNCWSAALGDGWWRGTIGGQSDNTFGYKLSYIGQLELEYEDGSTEYILTNESFKTSTGGLLASDMLFGDLYDARKEPSAWKTCGYNSDNWKHAEIDPETDKKKKILITSRSVPVRQMETFKPDILHTPNGATVLDFGQNIAGYVSMKLHNCKSGNKIILIHGETLDEDGNFTQKNYAQTEISNSHMTQKVEYIMCGSGTETYCPMFSIFGFRYVLLQGYTEAINSEDFEAIAVYSEMKETGSFSCSNLLLNQLVKNSLWSQKGNFMDVPTDCPTRERNPYTGDAQVYVQTAIDFMDVYSFFEKWMLDYIAEQFPTGKIPNTVPSISASNHNPDEQRRRDQEVYMMEDGPMKDMILSMSATKENGSFIDGSSGWADAATIIPYMLYLNYGDIKIYENQYECCRKWVDYISHEAEKENPLFKNLPYYTNPQDAKYVWDSGFHWGEWLEPDINIYADMWSYIGKLMSCPEYLSATMFYYYSAKIVSDMAATLEKREDAEKYCTIANRIKEVYNKYFIREDGVILENRQALHVRAIAFGLVNKEKKKAVAEYLHQLIKNNNYTLNTGFLSTPYLLHVLADNGYTEAAYRLLEKTDSPSWLKSVKDGATSIPETWDGYETCSSSLNHYSYGSVCDFLFGSIAGIRPLRDTPGYKRFLIKPLPGGSLTHAHAAYESNYGTIKSSWTRKNESLVYTFKVPVNTRAFIQIKGDSNDLKEIKKLYSDGIQKNNTICFEVGSGEWSVVTKG